jgi:hypothetical protein
VVECFGRPRFADGFTGAVDAARQKHRPAVSVPGGVLA